MTFIFEISHYFYSSPKVQQNLANNLILLPHTSPAKTLPVHLSPTIPVIMWRRHHSRTFLLRFNCLWLWLILFPFNVALGLRMNDFVVDGQHYAIHFVSALIGILSIHAARFSKTIRWSVPRWSLTPSQQITRHSEIDFKQTLPSIFYICKGVFLMSQEKWLTYCFWRSAHIMTQQTFQQPTGADCTPPPRCHQT